VQNAFPMERDVNVWVQLGRGGADYYAGLDPHHAVARLERFEPRRGARIRGTLELRRRVVKRTGYGSEETQKLLLYEGAGGFEVEICDDPPALDLPAQDATAIANNLGGTWNGKPLQIATGVAELNTDDDNDNLTHLSGIMFAPGEPYDCELAKQMPRMQLTLNSMGGTSKSKPLAGPQRVSVGISHRDGGHSYLFDQEGHVSWIEFHRLAWQAGEMIEGTLYAASASGAEEPFRIMGRFKARICR
jgi:hypothetical protein